MRKKKCMIGVPDPTSKEVPPDYRDCGELAVNYYMGCDGTLKGRKFWLCAYHWDIHSKVIAAMEADGTINSKPTCCPLHASL